MNLKTQNLTRVKVTLLGEAKKVKINGSTLQLSELIKIFKGSYDLKKKKSEIFIKTTSGDLVQRALVLAPTRLYQCEATLVC